MLNNIARFAKILSILAIFSINSHAAEVMCPKGTSPDPNVIWCDSFEDEDLGPGKTVGENYFNFNPGQDPENMKRIDTQSIHGNYSLKNHWNAGAGLNATGSFMRTFGRNPVNSLSNSTQDFDEIYWRFYIKLQAGFSGQAGKLTRAFSFAGSNWQQAMVSHLWTSGDSPLFMDPVSGIDPDTSLLATTEWNDFANFKYLGQITGSTKLTPDTWYCIEAHVKLNTPGQADGVSEFWRDGILQASRSNLNWRSSWTVYGINTIMFSDYWNTTSPKEQERYLDALVISTERIGCLNTPSPVIAAPKPPSNIIVQ